MIVDAFLNSMRDVIYGDSITMPAFIAIGTGTTAAAAGDTTLETEILPDGSNRSAISGRTKPIAKDVRLQMLVGAGEANGNNLTEVGAINAATGGTLMNHMIHTVIPKTVAFELKYQIRTTLSDV